MAEIQGGRGHPVQKRSARRDGWTRAKRAQFLGELEASCNFTRAAKAAGMTVDRARSLRGRDPVFAGLCRDALQAGYDRLEMELVARAIAAVADDENPTADEIPMITVAMDVATAMRILQMRGSGERTARAARRNAPLLSEAEVDAELIKRLAAVERRLART